MLNFLGLQLIYQILSIFVNLLKVVKIIKEILLLISTALVNKYLTVQEILVLFIGMIAGTIIVKM